MATGLLLCSMLRSEVQGLLCAEVAILNTLQFFRGFNRCGDGEKTIKAARVEGSILVLCTVEHGVYRVVLIAVDARDTHHHTTCIWNFQLHEAAKEFVCSNI